LFEICKVSAQNKELLQDYLRKRHSVSKLVVHLVFTTKYRRKLFTGVMIEQLREAFESACIKLECELIEMDGEQDHVHLLVSYPPKLSISVMVNNLKAVSSRMLRIQNTHLTRLSKSSALWSRSYFACTAGGATIETLKAYVESQSTPD
jgi:putative transposase